MKVSEFDSGENNYSGGNYGNPRDMPEDGGIDQDKEPVKGAWYDPL
jgi:hypothetical protein